MWLLGELDDTHPGLLRGLGDLGGQCGQMAYAALHPPSGADGSEKSPGL